MKASNNIRMPVLKMYFKVLRKNLASVFIYAGIFMLIAVMSTKMGGSSASTNFTETKADVAYFNYDGNTPVTQGLKTYLANYANFVNVKDNTNSLQDALFFQSVEYIVKIPKGFTSDLLSGSKIAKINKTTVSGSSGGVYMDEMINRYLSDVELFHKSLPGMSQTQLAALVKNNLSIKTDVTMKSYGSVSNKLSSVSTYFSLLVYSFLSIMFMVVSSLMMIFNNVDLRKRTLSSPVRPLSMNLQLFLGHVVVTLALWVCYIIIAILLCGTDVIGPNFALMCLNSLCFAIAALALSFLIGGAVHSHGAQNGIANVLSLGMCFISGVFVPQALLSSSLLSVARFTPAYWYVKAVNDISGLVVFSSANLAPIIYAMLIEIGFAAAFFCISLVIGKRKSLVA